MKKSMMLAGLILFSVSSSSFAAERVCGKLGSYESGPECAMNVPCPEFVEMRYDIVQQDHGGKPIDLVTSSEDVLSQLSALQGQMVCVQGVYAGSELDVSSISEQ